MTSLLFSAGVGTTGVLSATYSFLIRLAAAFAEFPVVARRFVAVDSGRAERFSCSFGEGAPSIWTLDLMRLTGLSQVDRLLKRQGLLTMVLQCRSLGSWPQQEGLTSCFFGIQVHCRPMAKPSEAILDPGTTHLHIEAYCYPIKHRRHTQMDAKWHSSCTDYVRKLAI